MSVKQTSPLSARLMDASRAACERLGLPPVTEGRLDDALTNAVDPQRLIDNVAEAWRTDPTEAKTILESQGFGGLLARLRPRQSADAANEVEAPPISTSACFHLAGNQITIRAINPAFDEPVRAPQAVIDAVAKGIEAFLPGAADDALGVLYRREPETYAKSWLADTAPRVDGFIRDRFGEAGPTYLVNSGIGANEQFNYFVAALANARTDRPLTWLLANSPKEIATLPADATVENTLFMEFSRSGITQETVKLHELTPPEAVRVVFANSGPLKALARRDGNLLLELPSEVSGRYGRNKTPILMAPMHVAGLDVGAYWATIQTACDAMSLGSNDSPPVVLARFIRLQQLRHGINHVYLGTNSSLLQRSADELCQFWNEGVNRDGNDITMSRYLGLPRDSHMNLEAILGTCERKMAIFLLQTGMTGRHPLLRHEAAALDPEHAGLTAAETDLVLTLANAKRCSEKMPVVLITVDQPDLNASAWLGQLWADVTLVYSRLIGVDPGSNPEVKAVRTRAGQWLANRSEAMALIGWKP
jgi:hypothetical protein